MTRLFLSHSSKNNAEAIALFDWLKEEGWDDVFLDLDPNTGIAPGQRWMDALHESAHRCEAVLFLVSRAWLASEWCEREFDLAQNLSKRCFGIVIDDLDMDKIPLKYRKDFQLVNLRQGIDHGEPRKVQFENGQQEYVTFSQAGLTRLKNGLVKAGLDPRFFDWPPANEPDRSPFRGLRPLDTQDAGIYFGREAHIIDFLDRLRGLRDWPVLPWQVIQGPSGSGKSSFLRAGIWPRLQRNDREFFPLPILRPESAPLLGENSGLLGVLVKAAKQAGLSVSRAQIRDWLKGDSTNETPDPQLVAFFQQLAPEPISEPEPVSDWHTKPLLVLPIDQAEELFYAENAEQTSQLLSLLAQLGNLPELRLLVVCTVRSISYEPLQAATELDTIPQQTFPLRPLSVSAYQQVIEGPIRVKQAATKQSFVLEPQLTAAILADIETSASKDAFPLLAFTLERLLEEYGDDGDLRLDEYQDMGGLKGTVTAAIEATLETAMKDPAVPAERTVCLALLRRGLIPWLAGIDPASQLPRRRLALLSQIPQESRPLIQHFINSRLLIVDNAVTGPEPGSNSNSVQPATEITVEPAHDSLLNYWSELNGWLEEDAYDLSQLEHLQQAVRDWDANQQQATWLIHSEGRLAGAESLAQKDEFAAFLTQQDRAYLQACRTRENDRKDQQLRAAQEREQAAEERAQAAQEKEQAAQQLAASQRKIASRTRLGLVISILLLVAASGAGVLAFQKQQEAETNLAKANSFLDSIQKSMTFLNFHVRDALEHYAPSSVRIPVMQELDRISELLNQHGADDLVSLRQRWVALIQKAELILQNSELDPVEAKALAEEALFIA